MYPASRPDSAIEFLNNGAHGACLHLLDENRRPLGERSAPEYAKAGLVTEDRISTYRGRVGLLMNSAGYKQVMQNWRRAMPSMMHLRDEYCRRQGVSSLGANHLWRLARIISSVIAYCAFRRNGPLKSGNIPSYLSTMYKVGGGPFLASIQMLMTGNSDSIDFCRLFLPDEYLRYVEDNGVFNVNEGACPAPPSFVTDFLSFLICGPEVTSPGYTFEENEAFRNGSLDAIPEIDDDDRFFSYAMSVLKQDYLKIVFALNLASAYLRLRSMMLRGEMPNAQLFVDEIGYRIVAKSGWLFGIGKRIFDASTVLHFDERVLSNHINKLSMAGNAVYDELIDLGETTNGPSWRLEFPREAWRDVSLYIEKRLGLLPRYELEHIQTRVLLAEYISHTLWLERTFHSRFSRLQAEIDEHLGWGQSDFTRDIMEKGAEVPLPTKIALIYLHISARVSPAEEHVWIDNRDFAL